MTCSYSAFGQCEFGNISTLTNIWSNGIAATLGLYGCLNLLGGFLKCMYGSFLILKLKSQVIDI